jgi:chromosome segregation ATPase
MSTSLEQIKSKVDELGKRLKAASIKKSNLSGLVQAKRDELAALKKEIEDAGLDPKKLKEKRDELQTEVQAMIEDFEKRLVTVEEAFAAFEAPKK